MFWTHHRPPPLTVRITLATRKALTLAKGDTYPLQRDTVVGCCLAWERLPSGDAVDIDLSVVAVSGQGQVLMEETVYFANLKNSNGSIAHSGDEQTGDEDLYGSGDDEIVTIHTSRIPSRVRALIVLATVATEDKVFNQIKSAR